MGDCTLCSFHLCFLFMPEEKKEMRWMLHHGTYVGLSMGWIFLGGKKKKRFLLFQSVLSFLPYIAGSNYGN